MRSLFNSFGIAVTTTMLFAACSSTTGKTENVKTIHEHDSVATAAATTADGDQPYQKGDRVPNELVCMVNNQFMGKKQLEVVVEGKTYYGCCKMCQERIPRDASVRTALDLHTSKPVDKASAYIVIVGDNGEVAYFEGEESYHQFFKE